MHFSISQWPRQTSLVILVLMALAQASAGNPEDNSTPADARADRPSTLHVVTQEHAADEASEEPVASADQSPEKLVESADPTSAQPVASADQTPDESAESADDTPDEPVAAKDAKLTPVPDPENSGPPTVETASFKGVTPGVTTLDELQKAWGPPKEIADRNARLVHLYTVEPFERVEVSFVKSRVAAIVIRLARSFPANAVAEQLELSSIQPVLVSDEWGKVLGQSFPERGVLFAFEPSETPGSASMKVVRIILEPVSAEAFVLRAETRMDSQPDLSSRDLEQAIKIDPNHARAHWLRARVLAAGGDSPAALEACSKAVRLEPSDSQYRVTRAQILGQLGRFGEGIEEAQKAMANSTKRPHVKARALCLLGDLVSSQAEPDYRQAIEYHMEAIKVADPLAVSRHPAIRIAAKEVLIDAHLGAGHDIAWGPWDHKEKAVPRWLEQAAAVAHDLIQNDGGSPDHQFRVATGALAACVGMRGKLDPTSWAEEALRIGQELIAATPDSPRKEQIRWDLGMALYDIVQTYQMRGDHQTALVYGQRAIGYLEPGADSKQAGSSETYLLGRLYFRLGAIHAVGQHDHSAAVSWFEKAIPVFEDSISHLPQPEFGRLGETFVSMGVSFWESGQQERAVGLTQRGVELMERAVKARTLDRSALEIPYGNLATMAREMGKNDQAKKYLEEAKKHKPSATR